jgi:DNA-binding NtrC family response regulator
LAKTLLVEDDEDVRYALAKFLRHAGHTVSEAVDGKQAIALVGREAFDIVITDIIMPEADGIEVVLEVRKRHPGLPIIAISGGGRIGRAEYLDAAQTLGANAVMQKPLDTDALLELIEQQVSRG